MSVLEEARERVFRLDLLDRLVTAQVGGCTCLTKTPAIEHHASMCHFRLFHEAQQEIVKLCSQQQSA